MTDQAFDEGMAILCATFPNLALTTDTLLAWRKLLGDMEDDHFRRGIFRLCREVRELYPNTNLVALIREKALASSPALAVLKVERAMRVCGAYQSIAFDDPVIHIAIERMGGWPALCAIPMEEWKFTRRDFEKIYDAIAREGYDPGQTPKHLPGIVEVSNNARGFQAPVPLYLYGEAKRKAITAGEEA